MILWQRDATYAPKRFVEKEEGICTERFERGAHDSTRYVFCSAKSRHNAKLFLFFFRCIFVIEIKSNSILFKINSFGKKKICKTRIDIKKKKRKTRTRKERNGEIRGVQWVIVSC